MLEDLWEINSKSWHCSHPQGFSAFVDPNPTSSGAIRVLGPWVPNDLPKATVSDALAVLVFQLEEMFEGQYAVFGGYAEMAKFPEHQFPIYSSSCGFVPSLAIRGSVTKDIAKEKEWLNIDRHRSGLALLKPAESLDKTVVHPLTIDADLHFFCDQRNRSFTSVREISTTVTRAFSNRRYAA